MMEKNIENVTAAIHYIENHLTEKIDLEMVANALHYSKFHLHHIFTDTVGLTIHEYIQRRQLTEAAKRLVFSNQPILEISLTAGYDSQQSFTTVFKAMYKKTPSQYRKDRSFYPLQLRYILNGSPTILKNYNGWEEQIIFAQAKDIPQWMDLVHLVIDGFPYLDEKEYLQKLQKYIYHKQAFILKDKSIAIGIMAFHKITGSIDFLGIHPQYQEQGIEKAFLKKAFEQLASPETNITITTFRESDKADTGYRHIWKTLGFTEAELLMEFGYPTQRFILQKEAWEEKENG